MFMLMFVLKILKTSVQVELFTHSMQQPRVRGDVTADVTQISTGQRRARPGAAAPAASGERERERR